MRKKMFTVALAFLMVTGFGAAMNKGELIDKIADEADLEKADGKRALDAFMENTQDSLSRGDRVALVGFGTVVSDTATRHGGDVRDAALLFDALCNGETLCDNVVADTATGHGDDVLAIVQDINNGNAVPLHAREGRNPQTGGSINLDSRNAGQAAAQIEDPGDVEYSEVEVVGPYVGGGTRHASLTTLSDLDGDGDIDAVTVWINDGSSDFEKAFNISIPDEEAEDIETVGEAIEYLEKNAKG